MNTILPVEAALASSDTFRSLRAERETAEQLSTLGWNVVHSPYYIDPTTTKVRELDVAATRSWRKRRKSGDINVRVTLFVEVKSSKDFHVLCAGRAHKDTAFGNNEHWIGYSDETRTAIESLLETFKFDYEAAREFHRRVERVAFPSNTMRTAPLRVSMLPTPDSFTAFRETNTKTEKDLENSVLWRAISTTRSAVRSAHKFAVRNLISDLGVDIEYAKRRGVDPLDELESVDRHSRSLTLCIPIVVIESRLWAADSPQPQEIGWFRFVQTNVYGHTEWWADVVNRQALPSYFEQLNTHLSAEYKRIRAVRD